MPCIIFFLRLYIGQRFVFVLVIVLRKPDEFEGHSVFFSNHYFMIIFLIPVSRPSLQQRIANGWLLFIHSCNGETVPWSVINGVLSYYVTDALTLPWYQIFIPVVMASCCPLRPLVGS